MDSNEFSWRFDTLFNNITSNQAPGLNEAEKSMFLTKAQEEKLKNYFNPKGNKYGEGYDDSQKRQIDFSMLTKSADIAQFGSAVYDNRSNSKSVTLPSDIMMIVNERVTVSRSDGSVNLVVRPLKYDEYDSLMSKPFKRPLNYQAWRLINHESANKADLIVGPSDTITKYTIRYVRKPKPIIIGDMDGLTLDSYTFGTGADQTQGCELDSSLHEEILQRAVELAKISWTATGQDNTQAVLQSGQNSE